MIHPVQSCIQDSGDELQSNATVLDQPYHPRVTVPHTQPPVACAVAPPNYVRGRLMLRWSYSAVLGGLGNLVAAVSSDMIPGPALPSQYLTHNLRWFVLDRTTSTGFYVRGGLAPV